jgi:tetratricopeptide (TPR) repeat protein
VVAWGAVGIASWALVTTALRERERRIALGLVWIAAFLAPVLNLVPIGTLMNDRYLYAPLCAIAPMLAAGVAAAARVAGRRARFPLGGPDLGAILAPGGRFERAIGVWRGAVDGRCREEFRSAPRAATWDDSLAGPSGSAGEPRRAILDPASPRPYVNLGAIHFRQGRYRLAAAELEAAAKLAPKDFGIRMSLASAQARAGRDREAIASLRWAERLRPGSGGPWLGIGLLLEQGGDAPGARRAFEEALAARDLDPAKAALAEAHLRDLRLRKGDRGKSRGSAHGLHHRTVEPRAQADEEAG